MSCYHTGVTRTARSVALTLGLVIAGLALEVGLGRMPASEALGPVLHTPLLVASLGVADNFDVFINTDTTDNPIKDLYFREVRATDAGDALVAFNKYFRMDNLNEDILEAVETRGVEASAVYRDDVSVSSSDCLALSSAACQALIDAVLHQADDVHHKNLMVRKADGTVRAIIGSFNLRDKHGNDAFDPDCLCVKETNFRMHTALFFTVTPGQTVFHLYRGELRRLRGQGGDAPRRLSIPAVGGHLQLTLHPHPTAQPVAELLQGLSGCDSGSTLWVSYFSAYPDTIGTPVLDELDRLTGVGCAVRLLVSRDGSNQEFIEEALTRGLSTRIEDHNATLGHKLVVAKSAGRVHVLQSSTDLKVESASEPNLTVAVHSTSLFDVYTLLDAELQRIWDDGTPLRFPIESIPRISTKDMDR